MPRNTLLAGISTLAVLVLAAQPARAHCDTMDGPVVQDAKTALEKSDPAPVLKWVQPAQEDEIRQAFKKTLAVRTRGAEARELADLYFFETLVRIHRAGEGAPYTGLKPAGADLEPGAREADAALESGSPDALVKAATESVTKAITERFTQTLEAKKHAAHNVEAGRKFVAAYVDYVHFVVRILDGTKPATHNPAPAENHHQH